MRDPSVLPTARPAFGLVYWHPYVYRGLMRLLEREAAERRRLIIDEIDPGDLVVDLCCGDCAIAGDVRARGARYVGLDLNPRFVRWAQRRGIDARSWDARTMEIPEADVVCMQSSLYHFIPGEREMLERMLRSARRKVIVSEPVVNWTTSASRLLRALARVLTRVDGRAHEERLNEEAMARLVAELEPGRVRISRSGRDVVLAVDVRDG